MAEFLSMYVFFRSCSSSHQLLETYFVFLKVVLQLRSVVSALLVDPGLLSLLVPCLLEVASAASLEPLKEPETT